MVSTRVVSRGRVWIFRTAAVGLGCGFALVVAELVFRLFTPVYSPLTFDIYYRDSQGLLRLRPSVERWQTTPEWNISIRTNSQGFRDVDRPPRPDEPIVLALGDSMAFGWGVDYKEAFLTRFESSLGGPDRVRVVKAAIPGTGPTDQRDLLATLLPTTPAKLVLLAFFVGNDFDDVAEGGAGQFQVIDGLLVRQNDMTERLRFAGIRMYLKRHSHLAQWAAQQLWIYQARRTAALPVEQREHAALASGDPWLRDFVQIHLRDAPPHLQRGIDGTLAALTDMRQMSTDAGARFVLLVIPRSIQVYDSDRTRYEQAFRISRAEWDLDRPTRILQGWAVGHQAELIDALPALREAAAASAARLYYFPDSHMTAAGHAVVAAEISRYFAAHPL